MKAIDFLIGLKINPLVRLKDFATPLEYFGKFQFPHHSKTNGTVSAPVKTIQKTILNPNPSMPDGDVFFKSMEISISKYPAFHSPVARRIKN